VGGWRGRKWRAGPRRPDAMPATTSPAASVASAPKRAISSEAGNAPMANRITGNPERMPISVPERCRSPWMSAITGGTARIVSRRPTPASQSRPTAAQNSRITDPGYRVQIMSLSSSRENELGRAREPFERLGDLGAPQRSLLALLALAFHHVLGRAPHEIGIGKLGVDAGDVGIDPRDLLLEPRLLDGEINHAGERHRCDLAAHHDLHRARRRAFRQRKVGEAREPSNASRPLP